MKPAEKRWRKAVIELARQRYMREGEVEIDDSAAISTTEENGAYVHAWVWVSFRNTPLCTESNEGSCFQEIDYDPKNL